MIRLQAVQPSPPLYTSLGQTWARIAAEEGFWPGLLRPGLVANLYREAIYSSLRMGLYPYVRGALCGEDADPGLAKRLLAGLLTGAIGSALANPLDLVKIRMQAEAGVIRDGRYVTGLRTGSAPTATSTMGFLRHAMYAPQPAAPALAPPTVSVDALRRVNAAVSPPGGLISASAEAAAGATTGPLVFRPSGLFRGVGPTAARAALLTAGQMGTYDHSKTVLKRNGLMNEGLALHSVASLIAGLTATTISMPADVIKTRLMAARRSADAAAAPGPPGGAPLSTAGVPAVRSLLSPTTTLGCVVDIIKREGMLALWRGWWPAYLRIGAHFIICLPLNEQIRSAMGLSAI
ncbi:hypothetical protein H696_02213 [Fonticula alba]|uniref:Uncharacterized protein n=1 Tax=Fonticula alba TaxID=691883 RepID=A0A058ZBF8_FONAL|nr:hypothetical protein H696_02213 [Fonticula alba]KCV71266.1 hypothetical protein H696_02213 [Fonticula alba]|eukprot:XP_009494389.1 hypothetical protein H696_02213 [Fonticula alba]